MRHRQTVDWRKSSFGRAEIGGFSLIDACGNPLARTGVGIYAQFEFQFRGVVLPTYASLARRHQRLRHVVAVEDLVPYSLRKFIATVGGATSVTRARLKEQLATRAPELVGIGRAIARVGSKYVRSMALISSGTLMLSSRESSSSKARLRLYA